MTHGLSPETVNKIHGVLAQHAKVQRAVIYGSRAKGNYKPGSDIDLTLFAVEGQEIDYREVADILDEIDDLLLPYTLDLSAFEQLNHVKLREHIERVGKVFYEREGAGEYSGAAMKAGWQVKPVGESFRVVNGGTPKTGVAAYWDGDHQWITPAEMGGLPSPYLTTSRRTLTDEGLRVGAELVPSQSIILSSRAPIGHLVINEAPMAFNQGCKGLIPSPGIDTKFAYYYLLAHVPLLNSLGTGATFKELSAGKLKEVPFRYPPLPEQHRIVALLDDAFDGIATAKANAEKNLQNARALFESYLQNVFTERGEGWVETTIGECIRFIDYRGKTPVKTDSGLRLITAKNVKMGYLQESPMEFVAPESYDAWMTRGIPKQGDVLFTTEAPLANVAQLDTDEKVVFAQRIIIMQPEASRLDSTFLKYLLLSQPVQQRIHGKGTGATVKGIKASLLKTIEISFPYALDVQKSIVSKLDDLTIEVERLESICQKKLTALDDLKKSLLHQAFSGAL